MTKNIDHTYYRCALVACWIFSLLSIAGTWLAFLNGHSPAIVFSIMTDVLLALSLILITVFLFLSEKPHYRKRAFISLGLLIAHIAFFVCALIVSSNTNVFEDNYGVRIVFPSLHTVILVGVWIFGLYFTNRRRYLFKFDRKARKDAAKAFGGKVEDDSTPAPLPTAEEIKKPARDEKTGIVSL